MAVQDGVKGFPNVSLNAATVTGVGQDFRFQMDGFNQLPLRVTWEILITGGPASCVVDLEGSLDDTNWYQLGTNNTTSSSINFTSDKAVFFLRANLKTLTGGTSPTITVKIVPIDA